MRRIYINISDIASYIGQNKWNCITPFERIWKKADLNYNNCLNDLKNQVTSKNNELIIVESEKETLNKQLLDKKITKRKFNIEMKKMTETENKLEEDIKQNLLKIDNVSLTQTEQISRDLGDEITNVIANASKETNVKRKIVNESINKLVNEGKISNEKSNELFIQTESLINKTHGILTEQSAIDIFEEKFNVKLDITQKYFNKHIFTNNDIEWFIGGRLDGITKDYIVEVKNRTKGFFNSLRDYENTQIQLYLYLTNHEQAKLVEKFNKKIRITDICKDQVYIDETISYLQIFILNFDKFINNTNLKIQYLNSYDNDKLKILNTLFLNEINSTRIKNETLKFQNCNQNDYLSDLDSDSSL
jgi:hypothetical protein